MNAEECRSLEQIKKEQLAVKNEQIAAKKKKEIIKEQKNLIKFIDKGSLVDIIKKRESIDGQYTWKGNTNNCSVYQDLVKTFNTYKGFKLLDHHKSYTFAQHGYPMTTYTYPCGVIIDWTEK